ncbi:MAG: thrombospondin type 3 repeat-containing protein [Candidatus Poseidonia sp.]|nr:thrombospondin type 3 repeat-containing protein [Poseidonia sp.]
MRNQIKASTSPLRSSLITAMLILGTLLSAVVPTVQAVGPNQNDLNSGGDLPDNTTVNITNYIFSNSFTGSGELDYGDDSDFLRVALTSTQGLSASLSFPTSTTFANGTTVTNDFDLIFYDSSLNYLDESYMYNPETLTTNTTAAHGGMLYIEIVRWAGSGSWNLTLHKFTVSNGTGGGGGGATSITNCTGAGTLTSDILEPNDGTSTASGASLLPLSCTGLSIHTTTDSDYFEVDMIAGVTYYANISFTHTNGDIDVEWLSASSSWLTSSGSSSNLESMQYTSSINQTTYVNVYGFFSATNTYDIEITTDNPGGGQSFETVDVFITNTSHATLSFSGLTNNTSYNYNYSYGQMLLDNNESWATSTNGTFNTTGTTHSLNITIQATMIESVLMVSSTLSDASGSPLDSDMNEYYIEMVEIATTSSTTGDIELTNLTVGTDYEVEWVVLDFDEWNTNFSVSGDVNLAINASMIDSDAWYLTPTTTSMSYQINWTGPTTMNDHLFLAYLSLNGTVVNLSDNTNILGLHFEDFVPQLPALVIDTYSASSTASNNNVQAKGLDLVVNDDYQYQYRMSDASGANLASSSLTSFTATAQNMSMPSFSYSTPTSSGTYCVYIDLYSDASVQLIGDSNCFQLSIDDDGDGVANELDLCANTTAGVTVDQNGCALSQKDSDGDGYNDAIDAFPYDASQYSDMDGDGYGDNASGNMPDAFPTDGSQWSDADGDGYGDNASGTTPDAFPTDPTQWSDADGDGYGDNASGNNPDEWPADSTQWSDGDGDGYGDNPSGTNGDAFPSDATQWSDADGDGYGDNPSGTTPDGFPTDGTQWADADGDGYGDNPNGNNADAFPNDASQWSDADGDGYGDNQLGTTPDAFPNDSTQWSDTDGDGYGDNAAGMNPDAFPADATQWTDADNDGLGDNANGNNPDLCLNTPAGQTVDANGCSPSQLDGDMDGVNDAEDACPDTPAGEQVDNVGCSSSQEDQDNDMVMDAFDACPNTPLGSQVDAAGCALSQLDTDGDTITDDRDACPTTTLGLPVNGVGCAAEERDTDGDNVNDAADICDATPSSEVADAQGCAPSQKDSDADGITNDIDNCPGTGSDLQVDLLGCATNQLDADNDQISDADDICPVTPAGEQPDAKGCSDSQKDEDNDDINNNKDLCPDTPVTQQVDVDGCSEQQKDDDDDGIKNHLDECPKTLEGELINPVGCALSQLDSDGDGVSDDEDAFKFDANESVDSDGDGVADRWDAYPQDSARSQTEAAESGNGLLYAIITVLLLTLIGGGGYVFTRKPELNANPFGEPAMASDSMTDQYMTEGKSLPSIQEATGPQQWEENGVHWSRDESGALSYFDAATNAWIPYEG